MAFAAADSDLAGHRKKSARKRPGDVDVAVRVCRRRGVKPGACAHLLDALDGVGDPEEYVRSRKELSNKSLRERRSWLKQNAVELALPLATGKTFKWSTLSPSKVLQLMSDSCTSQQAMLSKTLPPAGGPTPVLFYTDEIVPGNPLQPDVARKHYCFYVALHTTRLHVQHCHAWYMVAALRTKVIGQVAGGLSACTRILLESWQRDFQGVVLRLSPTDSRLFQLRLHGLIADEAAIASTLGTKSASGRKPCHLCMNLLNHSALDRAPHAEGDRWRTLMDGDIRVFEQTSNAQVWHAVDELRRQQPLLSAAAFAELEKNLGFRWEPHGVLASPALRAHLPPRNCIYDVLHNFFCGGIVSEEVALFTGRLESRGLRRTDLRGMLQNAQILSRHEGSSLHGLLRNLSTPFFAAKNWKAQGSTQRALLPLLHFWCCTYTGPVKEALAQEFACFELLCRRVAVLVQLQFCQQEWLLQDLMRLQAQHHDKFLATYGHSACKPKHHYALHQKGQCAQFSLTLYLPESLALPGGNPSLYMAYSTLVTHLTPLYCVAQSPAQDSSSEVVLW
ncbi:unnamed protein product [Symbiodinium natans]|uniref:Uncharacterized protein n=1 Tax=Symbiodinium natans TaxID=878477 RepID=A0A812R6W8_9DINO|nr:unnamed protein product [Symbiodinium natans]